ncbi:MAG: hypothetical protein IKW96_13615 [Ruminococcus sp.]|uniref:hypothetical protein n=1 Tax=Ruminococcus sp. TaxID=41978 RepID=UPI0025D62340|nr:hypothetical protein [Ruminococcus sp.]MBR5684286.1 hypothetical protein [Ruminococcus sp.]
MKMTRFISVISAAAISLCCISVSSAAAAVSANNDISALSANKQAGYNPCNKQDNKEVPYDGSKWLQPKKWGSTKVDPNNYKGKAKLWFDKVSITVNDARSMADAGEVQRICFHASGIQDKVSTMEFHIYYDARLTSQKIGRSPILAGGAAADFSPVTTFI